MQLFRSARRRRLDQRLTGLDVLVGSPPAKGWIREIRDALGMSSYELAVRMGIRQPRAFKLERSEVEGSIGLASLRRAAEALNCDLVYALVPKEPLVQLVRRQARGKALEVLNASTANHPRIDEDRALWAEVMAEQLEALAIEFTDRRGLWGSNRLHPGPYPGASTGPAASDPSSESPFGFP